MTDDPTYLSIKDFAALHAGALTENSVRKLVRQGRLPHVRLGKVRGVLIPRDGLERMQAQQEVERQAALQRAGG